VISDWLVGRTDFAAKRLRILALGFSPGLAAPESALPVRRSFWERGTKEEKWRQNILLRTCEVNLAVCLFWDNLIRTRCSAAS
jgi:hypothetical protein